MRATGRIWVLAAIVAALAVVAGVGVVTARTLESGQLFADTTLHFDRVLILGTFEVMVASEEQRPLDTVNGMILAFGSGVAAMAAVLIGRDRARVPGAGRLMTMFAFAAVGFGFLAVDEQLSGHETIGYTIENLVPIPGVNSPEDAVFAAYAVPALAFLVVFRRQLLASRAGAVLLGLGLALFLAAAALDVLDVLFDEQKVEVAGSLVLVAGFAAVVLHHLSARSGMPARDGGAALVRPADS